MQTNQIQGQFYMQTAGSANSNYNAFANNYFINDFGGGGQTNAKKGVGGGA